MTASLSASALIYQATKRKLCVVLPNLLAHTSLANEAQTIELMVLNKSRESEEDILVELDPKMQYELIASTHSHVEITKSSIKINRIPGNDNVVVIFMCEKGAFGKKSVFSISSKTTKGVMYEKLEDVPASFINTIGGLFIVLFILLAPLVGGVMLGSSLHAEIEAVFRPKVPDAPIEVEDKPDLPPEVAEILALDWQNIENFVESNLFADMEPKVFPISLGVNHIRNGIVTIDVEITNTSSSRILVDGRLISSTANGGSREFVRNFFHDALVLPGGSVTRQISAPVPEGDNPQIVIFEANISFGNQTTYNLTHDIALTE
ncbi:hypothetical protein [Maricaulis salignorans]|uniref:hypothetical protein n=1 Tax=Maricaulis salignorans TaxID=144026 RepID=UPI003A925473